MVASINGVGRVESSFHDHLFGKDRLGLPRVLRDSFADLQGGKCFNCSDDRLLTDADHFLPMVRYGIDAVENLILASQPPRRWAHRIPVPRSAPHREHIGGQHRGEHGGAADRKGHASARAALIYKNATAARDHVLATALSQLGRASVATSILNPQTWICGSRCHRIRHQMSIGGEKPTAGAALRFSSAGQPGGHERTRTADPLLAIQHEPDPYGC
jgi:hypothetical protein